MKKNKKPQFDIWLEKEFGGVYTPRALELMKAAVERFCREILAKDLTPKQKAILKNFLEGEANADSKI